MISIFVALCASALLVTESLGNYAQRTLTSDNEIYTPNHLSNDVSNIKLLYSFSKRITELRLVEHLQRDTVYFKATVTEPTPAGGSPTQVIGVHADTTFNLSVRDCRRVEREVITISGNAVAADDSQTNNGYFSQRNFFITSSVDDHVANSSWSVRAGSETSLSHRYSTTTATRTAKVAVPNVKQHGRGSNRRKSKISLF